MHQNDLIFRFLHQLEVRERKWLDEVQKQLDEFTKKMNTPANINENNTFLINLPETIRHLKENQEQINRQQDLWKKNYDEKEDKQTREIKIELDSLRQQIEHSIMDKRQIKQVSQVSQTTPDLVAIGANEKETMKKQYATEQLTSNDCGCAEKLVKLEKQINPVLIENISRAAVEKLIREAIENLRSTKEDDNSEFRELFKSLSERLTKLEKQYVPLSQSTNGNSTNRPSSKGSSRQTSIKNDLSSQKPLSRKITDREHKSETPVKLSSPSPDQAHDISLLAKRLTRLEALLENSGNNETKRNNSLNNTPADGHVPNKQSVVSVIEGQHSGHASALPNGCTDCALKIQNLQNQLDDLKKIKLDRQAVDDLIKLGAQRIEQLIGALQKNVSKHDDDLSKLNADLADIRRQLTSKATLSLAPPISKSLPKKKYTTEDLEAIMPFIEPLPIFDLLNENEWCEF